MILVLRDILWVLAASIVRRIDETNVSAFKTIHVAGYISIVHSTAI